MRTHPLGAATPEGVGMAELHARPGAPSRKEGQTHTERDRSERIGPAWDEPRRQEAFRSYPAQLPLNLAPLGLAPIRKPFGKAALT